MRLVPGRAPLWRRRLLRHRRALAAVLAALLAWSLTTALRPPTAQMVPVLVAARDLMPGTVLSDADVAAAALPPQAVPADAIQSTDATGASTLAGRTVVVPVRAGEPVLARQLLTSSLLAGYGPDVVATPVRLSDDASVSVLRPGDLVDVVAAVAAGAGAEGGSTATVVASRVRVLLAGTHGSSDSGGGALSALGSGADRSSSVVVLATTQQQGLALARAAVGARLSVLLRDG
jgi:Flp pilus assembly protein CpaB